MNYSNLIVFLIFFCGLISNVRSSLILGDVSFDVYDLHDNLVLADTLNATLMIATKQICSSEDLQDLNISSPSTTAILYIYSGHCHWLDTADALNSISFSAIIMAVSNGFFNALYVSPTYDVRIKKKKKIQ